MVTMTAMKSKSVTEYVLARVRKVQRVDGMTECWEWTAGRRGRRCAYGAGCVGGRSDSAHRISYRAFKGEIPEGALVCHKCSNGLCANPEHLYAGTYQNNADDMVAHGLHRIRTPARSRHGCAKLTDAQVAEIAELAKTKTPGAKIGARFGVTATQVSRIARNESWGDSRTPNLRRGHGEHNHMAKLTRDQALEIGRLVAAGGRTLKSIAADYGVTETTVIRIKQGIHWAVRPERETGMDKSGATPC